MHLKMTEHDLTEAIEDYVRKKISTTRGVELIELTLKKRKLTKSGKWRSDGSTEDTYSWVNWNGSMDDWDFNVMLEEED
jgi:hypothetical protein